MGAFSHKFFIAPSGETTDQIKKVRGAKMARISSIIMPNMVGIVGRAPAADEKVWCSLFVFFCFVFVFVFVFVCHALELRSLW